MLSSAGKTCSHLGIAIWLSAHWLCSYLWERARDRWSFPGNDGAWKSLSTKLNTYMNYAYTFIYIKELCVYTYTFIYKGVMCHRLYNLCLSGNKARGCICDLKTVEHKTPPRWRGTISIKDLERPEAGVPGPLPHPLAICLPVSP